MEINKGLIIGKYQVLKLAEVRRGMKYWECECLRCHNQTIFLENYLTSGRTPICSCRPDSFSATILRKTRNNEINEKLLETWRELLKKFNPKYKIFKNYGGKGLKLCNEWEDFKNFKTDMERTYIPGHFLKIIQTEKVIKRGSFVDKNTCRWVEPRYKQIGDHSIEVIFKGKKRYLTEIYNKYQEIDYTTVYQRIIKLKWSLERALTQPKAERKKSSFRNK